MKTFTIKIPAGIRNNEKIRLVGQGKKGENGAKNGDLLIKINIQNSKDFRLQGCNIHTDLKVTPWEAALGSRIELNTIDGQETVYLQKGVQSGEKIKISQKGYKDRKRRKRRLSCRSENRSTKEFITRGRKIIWKVKRSIYL